MALPVKKSQGEPETADRGSVGAVPTSAARAILRKEVLRVFNFEEGGILR